MVRGNIAVLPLSVACHRAATTKLAVAPSWIALLPFDPRCVKPVLPNRNRPTGFVPSPSVPKRHQPTSTNTANAEIPIASDAPPR
jgi:hypothetical protein